MAFCTTRTRFALGWFRGGNRRAFETLAAGPDPMGVIATLAESPDDVIGWCAAGPRSRYRAATDPSSTLMAARRADEDERVWLLPCLFVRADQRGLGLTSTLVEAATALARGHGATAVEGWPVQGASRSPGEDFVGRDETFRTLGFRVVDRPTPGRVIMRLDL